MSQAKAFGKMKGQTIEEYMATFDSVKLWLSQIKHGNATPGTKKQFVSSCRR